MIISMARFVQAEADAREWAQGANCADDEARLQNALYQRYADHADANLRFADGDDDALLDVAEQHMALAELFARMGWMYREAHRRGATWGGDDDDYADVAARREMILERQRMSYANND